MWQMMAANLYGQTGQAFDLATNETIDDIWQGAIPTVFTNEDGSVFWYRFVDLSPDSGQLNYATDRIVNATATCEELKITFGGYAGLGYTPDDFDTQQLNYIDSAGQARSIIVDEVATGLTTYMSNSSSESACGPRCNQVLVLQSANNLTEAEAIEYNQVSVPEPHLWSCNNTMSQVSNLEEDGFDNVTRLELPDDQARILAGAIGWSGVSIQNTTSNTTDDLQYQIIHGDNGFNLDGNVTAPGVAASVMVFSVAAVAAMDQRGGPRVNATGSYQPNPAQVLNVQWNYAGAILGGIPVLQFLMLLCVVWFSGKAIILEPGYLTAAHLLYPAMHKLGPNGILLTADEMAEKLGPDFKLAYSVRPNPDDPGRTNTEFTRDLDLIHESEGHGYIRGRFPEGRYD
jgi:hypothetical protein